MLNFAKTTLEPKSTDCCLSQSVPGFLPSSFTVGEVPKSATDLRVLESRKCGIRRTATADGRKGLIRKPGRQEREKWLWNTKR